MTTLEERARQTIDQVLAAAAWEVQDRRDLNLGVGLGRQSAQAGVRGAVGVAGSDRRAGECLAGATAISGAVVSLVL